MNYLGCLPASYDRDMTTPPPWWDEEPVEEEDEP